jgi:hypothetical protein
MTSDPAIATAADYADALLTARRAKSVLTLVVLLALVVQLAVFFIGRFTTMIDDGGIRAATVTATATMPMASTQPLIDHATNEPRKSDVAHYAMGFAIFLGLVCTAMLAMILYLIVKIMLVGRLIGVARVTSALVWTFFLLLLLFPWQAFLRNADFSNRDFMISGVLYTWDELRLRVLNGNWQRVNTIAEQIVFWARFVAWPVIALILLLVIHGRSNRGLRQALGEDVLSTSDTATT